MPIAKIDDRTSIFYRDAGSGDPPLVLIHGFPLSSAIWEPQIAALAGSYRVVSPDLRGFGRSPASAKPYSIARLADDIAELLNSLGVAEAVIAGLSMGGYVAFEFFRRNRDRVIALVLADTRPAPDSTEARAGRARLAHVARETGSEAVTQELLPKLLAPSSPASQTALEETLRELMDAQAPPAIAAALEAMAARADSRPLLPNIDVPVLVLVGSEDAITPPAETRDWANAIPGARTEIIERAGHMSNLEQPAAFNELLLEFLASLRDEGTRAERKRRKP